MNINTVLKEVFGYDSFRMGQDRLAQSILSGHDTLGVMPTGAGKSVCYQVPAIMMKGITIVISPLISLMQDQVSSLVQAGVAAAYINSSLSMNEFYTVMNNAARGVYKLIYIAPERLDSEIFLNFAVNADISMITVDEAHCISQWGQDFRPSYLNIPSFAAALPSRPVISAFTATATQKVRDDIARLLEMKDPFTLVTGFDRKNLYFDVRKPKDKYEELKGLVKDYCKNGRSGIIYCSTRKNVETVCRRLSEDGISVTRYHAGLDEAERKANQEDFIYDRRRVMVATNAFGMGIDKSNVTFVIHYNMPKDLESYYQEAGRAGRDGSSSDCILLYSGQDAVLARFLIDKSFEESQLDIIEAEKVRSRDMKRLRDMVYYCTGADCLRNYILKYFGEKVRGKCGNCSGCCPDGEIWDITVEAQKIMSCIFRAGQDKPIGVIREILTGMADKDIYGSLSTYGIMSIEESERINIITDRLADMGYIIRSDDKKLSIDNSAADVLKGNVRLETRLAIPKRKPEKEAKDELFIRLCALRDKAAKIQGIPPYLIFTDSTITEMCRSQPVTKQEMLKIPGISTAKMARYGDMFLEEIRRQRVAASNSAG